MFIPFFESLRKNGVPVSLREFLAFLDGMHAGLAIYDVEAFYKDKGGYLESHYHFVK